MEKKSSSKIVKRLIKHSIFAQAAILTVIFLFTKSIFYSIIFLLGTIISISGFLLMIKMIDRILHRGKGQLLFFLVVGLKMVVIAASVYLVSRSARAEGAVLFHILGLSIIVIAIAMEGIYRLFRSETNGGA
jgi:hypothetical protein